VQGVLDLDVGGLRTPIGETYADLATGFGIGTTTAFRYVGEALDVLAALAPSLHDAVAVATRKAFVIIDGTLLRIDRVGMGSGRDRRQGRGGCVELLPELIGRDELGYRIPATDTAVPRALQRHAQQAARDCPRLALRLLERRDRH
jgi:ferredoxin